MPVPQVLGLLSCPNQLDILMNFDFVNELRWQVFGSMGWYFAPIFAPAFDYPNKATTSTTSSLIQEITRAAHNR